MREYNMDDADGTRIIPINQLDQRNDSVSSTKSTPKDSL